MKDASMVVEGHQYPYSWDFNGCGTIGDDTLNGCFYRIWSDPQEMKYLERLIVVGHPSTESERDGRKAQKRGRTIWEEGQAACLGGIHGIHQS